MTCSCAVLAGGKSSRMGENKALLPLDGKLVIERIADEMNQLDGSLLVISNQYDPLAFLGLPVYSDRFVDKGPLAGIESALYHSPTGYVSITACDTPFISANVYRYLQSQANGKQAVIPFYDGRMHPLSGIYHTDISQHLRHCIENGELKLRKVLEKLDYQLVTSYSNIDSAELERHFFNMNHPEEYKQAMNFLK